MSEQQAQTIITKFQKLQAENNSQTDERAWISEHLTSSQLKEIVPKVSLIGLHILSALEAGEKNGITLAQELNVTRGGVSRAASKLEAFDLLEKKQRSDNKKNFYYALTPLGAQLAQVHDEMHAHLEQKLCQLLENNYTSAEQDVIIRFIEDAGQLKNHFATLDKK